MAYMSQQHKKELSPQIKNVLKKYNVKATIGVRHHSTLVLNVKSSKLDFLKGKDCDSLSINPYSIDNNHSDECANFLNEVSNAMMTGNHDKSDLMTDYHNVGWYIDINIGQWNKPYELVD